METAISLAIGAVIGLLTGFYFERRAARAARVVKGLLAKTESTLGEFRRMLERCVDERLRRGEAVPSTREEQDADDLERKELVVQLNALFQAAKQQGDNQRVLFGRQKPETIAEIARLEHRLAEVRSRGPARPRA